MAQSQKDSRKIPLHIDAFWEKSTVTPPLSWEKWTTQCNPELLAKEGSHLETLLNGQLAVFDYQRQPTYKETVEGYI